MELRTFGAHPPVGIHHAAGVLQDKLVRSMLSGDMSWTFSPKSVSAAHLHSAAAFDPLSAMLFFSSAAATFGQLGQANYAAANSYMDTLAETRRNIAVSASSLQLVLVLGAGMGQQTLDAMAGARGAEVAQWTLQMEQYAHLAQISLDLPRSPQISPYIFPYLPISLPMPPPHHPPFHGPRLPSIASSPQVRGGCVDSPRAAHLSTHSCIGGAGRVVDPRGPRSNAHAAAGRDLRGRQAADAQVHRVERARRAVVVGRRVEAAACAHR